MAKTWWFLPIFMAPAIPLAIEKRGSATGGSVVGETRGSHSAAVRPRQAWVGAPWHLGYLDLWGLDSTTLKMVISRDAEIW